jgi:hypothetical protein
MDPKVASTMWAALVRSCAEYAADVWSDADDAWPELEALQTNAARMMLRLGKSTKEAFVLGELGWMRLATRRQLARLKYFRRLMTMTPTRWPARIMRLTDEAQRGELN